MVYMRFLKPTKIASSKTEDSKTEDAEDLTIISFDSLPIDVVTKILHKLPSEFLHASARYVSKTWNEIISLHSFINSHLLDTQCGFLIQDTNKEQFMQARELEEIEETQINFNFHGKIRGSSDGVLLINKSVMELFVFNPVTMQNLKLPILPSICKLSSHCNNIARISSTGEIKVVTLGRDHSGLYNWYVIKIGKVMSWRKIKRVPKECDPASYLSYVQSLSANGVVYWTNSSWITNNSVLAIDLCDETVRLLKVPEECQGQYWTLVQMGSEICCMNCGKNVEMKVWKLKDLHKNEWVMVKSIRFSVERSLLRSNFSRPILWMDFDVLVMSVYVQASNVVVVYNVRKDEYRVIKIGDVARHAIFLHKNSLIRF